MDSSFAVLLRGHDSHDLDKLPAKSRSAATVRYANVVSDHAIPDVVPLVSADAEPAAEILHVQELIRMNPATQAAVSAHPGQGLADTVDDRFRDAEFRRV